MSTPQDDQLRAAASHTEQAVDSVAAITGHAMTELPKTGPVADAWRRWIATPTRGCRHLTSPAPAFAFLAVPGFMACGRCIDVLTAKYQEVVPMDSCDICRTPPPG